MNFHYELNESQNYNKENINTQLNTNKYLRNPNYNSEKRNFNHIPDDEKKNINDYYFEYCCSNKENDNLSIGLINDAKKKDIYYFNDLYEI